TASKEFTSVPGPRRQRWSTNRSKPIQNNWSRQSIPPGIARACLTNRSFAESFLERNKKYEDTTHCSFSGRVALRTARERGRRPSGHSRRSSQRIQSSISLSRGAADWLRQRFKTNSFRFGAATRRARSLAKSRRYQNCRCVETGIGCFDSTQRRSGTEGRSCNRARRKASRGSGERLLVWQRLVSRCGCRSSQ